MDHPTPRLRWIDSARWHITLAFIGEVDRTLLPKAITALDQVAHESMPLSDLQLRGAGTFATVLWLGVEPTMRHSPADRLARRTQRTLRARGFAIERRPWRAHLTVARFRPPARPAARTLAATIADYTSPAFDVDSITLFESVTGPQPRHIVRHTAKLRG